MQHVFQVLNEKTIGINEKLYSGSSGERHLCKYGIGTTKTQGTSKVYVLTKL